MLLIYSWKVPIHPQFCRGRCWHQGRWICWLCMWLPGRSAKEAVGCACRCVIDKQVPFSSVCLYSDNAHSDDVKTSCSHAMVHVWTKTYGMSCRRVAWLMFLPVIFTSSMHYQSTCTMPCLKKEIKQRVKPWKCLASTSVMWNFEGEHAAHVCFTISCKI